MGSYCIYILRISSRTKTANIKHKLLFIITHLFIFHTAVLAIHCFVNTRKKLQNFDQDKKLPLLPLMLGTKFFKKN